MTLFPKKENPPDLSKPLMQDAFVNETKDSLSLFQKELEVNRAEQNLLRKRMAMMKSFINDLPDSDPQYSMLVTQVQMDQIETDELKVRETLLIQKISDL